VIKTQMSPIAAFAIDPDGNTIEAVWQTERAAAAA
jgi:hypothetical protein